MKSLFVKLFARPYTPVPVDWEQVSSVLIRPIGTGLGDAVVLSAVCLQLKKAYPACKIGVLVSPRNFPIFKRVKEVDVCIKDTFLSWLKNRRKYEIMLDYQPTFTTRTILADFLLKSGYKLCFEKTPKKYYTPQTIKNYHFYVPQLATAHLSQSLTLTPFAPYVDAKNPTYALLKPAPKKFPFWPTDKMAILVCPFGSDRQLNRGELVDLLTHLSRLYRAQFICPFAPEKYPLPADLPIIYTGPVSLDDFLTLIAQADLCLAVDSAAVHLACAYYTPLVAFYSGWERNFKLFAPLDKTCAVCSRTPAGGPVIQIDNWPPEMALAICARTLASFAKM